MDLQDLREAVSNSLDVSKRHLNDLFDSTKKLVQRTRTIKESKPQVQEKEINKFLYTPDELPIFGKEYWFLLFTGTGPTFKDQLMASFGRNNNNSMQINNIPQFKDTNDYYGGIGETWFYQNGNTMKFGKLGGKIKPSDKQISFETDEYTIRLSGEYPNYQVDIFNGPEIVVNLTTRMPKYGDSLEFFSIERANLGVEIGNVYLDYDGTMDGKHFEGRCYMQKVIMSAPFIPWYWGRFVFSNGSVLVFFLLWVDLPGIDRTIYSQAKFYDTDTKSYRVISNFEVRNIEGTDYWEVAHHSKNSTMFVLLKVYTNNVFEMRSKGEFRYNETFSEIREIYIEYEGKVYDNDWFGEGSGSLEQATGMAF